MPSQYRILTQHPEGKQGATIEREKYDLIRCTILDALQREREMTSFELGKTVESKVDKYFEGHVQWYYTTVKLDLEAREEIERIPGKAPQTLRLARDRLIV